ncbi:hypothetical protein CO046_03775 [Candidatus Peregrinibacteria bacterium CG_4_9_14_0_2_um_filter_53_11]|nr:MAG: hypothetical protein CO046_03775 [Candidatus Peregrinibacteria bacterium CG_4_9_14_0_2_um_filter_53_11]
MSAADKLALLKEMLDSAESNLRSARQVLAELGGEDLSLTAKKSYSRKASGLAVDPEGQIVEGIFDGQKMIGPDGKSYPVPANYASKSKLVPGDVLKLTISDDGSFIYKQIGPVERKRVIGPLVHEDGQYKVLAGGKAYNVLLASITYYRASIGDKITLIVPEEQDSEWGAIDNVLPQFGDEEDSL